MNRIILIGNGFDRAHNLKTGYEHFINWLWEEEQTKLNEKNNWKFEQNTEDIKYHSTGGIINKTHKYNQYVFEDKFIRFIVEKDLFEKSNSFAPKLQQEKIKNILLRQIYIQKTLKNWVEIENEYYKALKTIINPDFSIRIDSETFHYNQIEKLNKYFENIKIELERYLTTVLNKSTEKIYSLEDLIYSKFSFDDFTKKGKDNLVDIAYEKMLYLQEKEKNKALSLKDTSEQTILNYQDCKEYLRIIESSENLPFSTPYYPLNKNIFISLISTSENYHHYIENILLPQNILFLNFNYTNTPDNYSFAKYSENKPEGYKKEFRINEDRINIHGELNNPKNSIIFGYGDELDEDYQKILKKGDNQLLENLKSIKYGATYNYKNLLNFIESDNYQVFIMGHSCGNSDRTLLNTLFEHENCQSIKIFYHEYKDDKGIITDNFSDIYRNITRNFTRFPYLRAKIVYETNSTPLPQLKTDN